VDHVQCNSLVLFQQVIESSEGKNMLKEVRECVERNDPADIRAVINIWRERLPDKCEPLRVWKDLLESRNCIFYQIKTIVDSKQIDPYIQDIPWNLLKLAQVSRKHRLFDQS
jgi:hypothetical protein